MWSVFRVLLASLAYTISTFPFPPFEQIQTQLLMSPGRGQGWGQEMRDSPLNINAVSRHAAGCRRLPEPGPAGVSQQVSAASRRHHQPLDHLEA